MADITMCRGENCSKREKCYRYTAPVDEYWQSVFTDTPKEIPCEHFLLNDGCIDGRKNGKWWKNDKHGMDAFA